jgi:hypothetical protein
MYTPYIIKQLKQKLKKSGYDHTLVELLLTYLESFSCEKKNSLYKNWQLYEKICYYSKEYSVIPITKNTMKKTGKQWVNDHHLFQEGSYGAMFDGEFKKEHVLTKTQKSFTKDIIREIFINMVIINDLLLRNNQFIQNLVPTYGLFACKQIDYKQVCIPDDDQPYYLNMIQKKVNAVPFRDFLSEATTTPQMLYDTLIKIFTTLQSLNTGPYQLRHNDLNGNNILIDNDTGEPIIIDWGLSTFKIKNIFYKTEEDNTLEITYDKTIENGSAIDIWWIIREMRWSSNQRISEYAKRLETLFFSEFLQNVGEKLSFSRIVYVDGSFKKVEKVYWFYYMIKDIEDQIVDNGIVHQHNLGLIKAMTYEMIKQKIEQDHTDNTASFTGIRRTRKQSTRKQSTRKHNQKHNNKKQTSKKHKTK